MLQGRCKIAGYFTTKRKKQRRTYLFQGIFDCGETFDPEKGRSIKGRGKDDFGFFSIIGDITGSGLEFKKKYDEGGEYSHQLFPTEDPNFYKGRWIVRRDKGEVGCTIQSVPINDITTKMFEVLEQGAQKRE